MSNDIKPRAMQILDAIFCAVEKLGGKINEDLSIKIKNDTVRLRLCEGQTKVKHELTKQEAVELVEYNDKLKITTGLQNRKLKNMIIFIMESYALYLVKKITFEIVNLKNWRKD